MSIDRRMVAGLSERIDADIEMYDWTCHDPGLDSLLSYQRNREQAQLVAKKIEQHYRAHPEIPIYITSHSGGTGIAIWALEALPDDVKVDTVILMASALSPGYDLSAALKHVKNHIYSISSTADAAVLGIGTRTFGTIDGVKTDAAGRVGFIRPSKADADLYEKLVLMPYDVRWMQLGNMGDHIGPMVRPFAKMILAPLLLHQALPDLPEVTISTSRPTTQSSTTK
jgi:pimeloyl-ACP methyl ester carboxylesterase